VKGEGPIVSENRSVKNFDGIDLDISANVFISKSDVYSIKIEAQANLLELIKTRKAGGILRISLKENCLLSSRGIDIYISMPEVTELSIGGSGSIRLEDKFETEFLYTSVSGSGDMIAEIIADEIECNINGSGSIELLGSSKFIE
jgi:hypothetical protein